MVANANIDQRNDRCLWPYVCGTPRIFPKQPRENARRRAGRRNARNRYVHFRRASNPAVALFIMLSRGITPRPVALVRSLCISLDVRSSLRKTASTRMYALHMHHCSLSRRRFRATTTTATMMMHIHITCYLIYEYFYRAILKACNFMKFSENWCLSLNDFNIFRNRIKIKIAVFLFELFHFNIKIVH